MITSGALASTGVLTPVAVRVVQFHLAELGKPDVLNGILPGLGRDWTEIVGGTQATVFCSCIAYAMEWEAVVARWARDDHAFLQPAMPCWAIVAVFCIMLMKAKTAKKELELCAVATYHSMTLAICCPMFHWQFAAF